MLSLTITPPVTGVTVKGASEVLLPSVRVTASVDVSTPPAGKPKRLSRVALGRKAERLPTFGVTPSASM